MRKLDPQLEFLMDGGVADLATTGDAEATFHRFGLESATRRSKAPKRGEKAEKATDTVTVLVQYAGDPAALKKAGLDVRSISGDVISGTIALSSLGKLSELAEVERIEAARSMHPELDLSLPETRANLVHTGPPGRRGAGVIVGICDSGCDFTHASFRRNDGTSRILFIWDQGLAPGVGEASPAGFGYGVEYDNARINAALLAVNPFATVRHRDPGGHGTHVTGIAAGDGSAAGQGRPGGTFVGVAPEADIIIVANASNGPEGLGTSANTLDAVNYIFQRAGTLSRPCVVNMSLGDNLGPHDGTSLLERGLDNLLGGAGKAFVKSAGNAGSARCHAEGNVVAGGSVDLRFNQPGGDNGANQIDLWYRGGDTLRISVIDPAGNATGVVNVGTATTFNLPGGNRVRIDHRNNDAFNGDRRVFMTFLPGTAAAMLPGNWTIRITSVASPLGGRFDAWIQRGNVVPTFLAPHESTARTISTPGTAREVITAANYITRGAGVGSLANSSSRGPTRDGRAAPTLAAPGSLIMSADGESSRGDPYRLDGGTSMSAPHITGTIALMLQKNGSRTQAQLKACLESSARSDAQTGPVPNTAWGAGKLDANAAVNCVPAPGVTRSVVTTCISITVACRPSVLTACVSVPRITCLEPSVVTRCPSVPVSSCGVISVTGCASALRCPSLVDGCPSTPGGCVNSLACNPQSLVCNPQSLACNPQSLACGVGLPGGGLVRLPVQSEGDAFAPLPEGWDAVEQAPQQPDVPAAGYFDYDENWFDEQGQ
jgi:subtilisin family serine protease